VLELDRAGTIDDGVAVAHEFGLGDVGLDAHQVSSGFGRGIPEGVLFGDLALPVDGPGTRQNCFEQRGLAAGKGSNQRNAPGPAYSAVCFCHALLLWLVPFVFCSFGNAPLTAVARCRRALGLTNC
jgi:hypothetical protein